MPASAAPAERGGPSLASLPDSALVIIFSKCSMSDRCVGGVEALAASVWRHPARLSLTLSPRFMALLA